MRCAAQLFVAIACAVHRQTPTAIGSSDLGWLPASSVKVLRKRCSSDRRARGRCHYFTGCLSLVSGGTICWSQRSQPASVQGIGAWVVQQMARYARDPARPLVLVYGSIAAQFTGEMAYAQFAAGGSAEAAQLVAALRERRPRPTAMWREMAAQHFAPPGGFFRGSEKAQRNTNIPVGNGLTRSEDGSHAASACVAHPADAMEAHQKWNAGSERELARHAANVSLVRVWASTRDASAAHLGDGDCTHFCQPSRVLTQWAAMLADGLRHALRGAPDSDSHISV